MIDTLVIPLLKILVVLNATLVAVTTWCCSSGR